MDFEKNAFKPLRDSEDQGRREVEFSCKICNAIFFSHHLLSIHDGYYHPKALHICRFCHLRFYSIKSYTRHLNGYIAKLKKDIKYTNGRIKITKRGLNRYSNHQERINVLHNEGHATVTAHVHGRGVHTELYQPHEFNVDNKIVQREASDKKNMEYLNTNASASIPYEGVSMNISTNISPTKTQDRVETSSTKKLTGKFSLENIMNQNTTHIAENKCSNNITIIQNNSNLTYNAIPQSNAYKSNEFERKQTLNKCSIIKKPCAYCGKVLPPWEVKTHRAWHENMGFKCDTCQKAFTTRCYWRLHYLRKHSVNIFDRKEIPYGNQGSSSNELTSSSNVKRMKRINTIKNSVKLVSNMTNDKEVNQADTSGKESILCQANNITYLNWASKTLQVGKNGNDNFIASSTSQLPEQHCFKNSYDSSNSIKVSFENKNVKIAVKSPVNHC